MESYHVLRYTNNSTVAPVYTNVSEIAYALKDICHAVYVCFCVVYNGYYLAKNNSENNN